MPQYGLIGYPLSHSFSKVYFTKKFHEEGLTNCRYDLFPIASLAEWGDLLTEHPHLQGLNVTIPYKEAVIPLLDDVSETAAAIGAVNTICIVEGRLKGFNTDAFGFELSLKNEWKTPIRGALILGTGGASKAVQYVLTKMGIPFLLVSRKVEKGDLTYADLGKKELRSFPLIVNTTPLGMHPATEEAPDIPYRYLSAENMLYDLIYNPKKTVFLKNGISRHCKVKNGMEMLYLQAERSWALWNDLCSR